MSSRDSAVREEVASKLSLPANERPLTTISTCSGLTAWTTARRTVIAVRIQNAATSFIDVTFHSTKNIAYRDWIYSRKMRQRSHRITRSCYKCRRASRHSAKKARWPQHGYRKSPTRHRDTRFPYCGHRAFLAECLEA